jgi:predicted amidophosphoribosyltransferase
MNEEPVKVCSTCGAEYSLRAESCADCGGKLVSPEDYEERFEPLANEEEVVLIREGAPRYLKELAQHMTKNGIRASIAFHGGQPGSCPSGGVRFGLYVPKADHDAAKEIDRVQWLQGAPDHATSFEYKEQELQGTCPACETALPKGATECPECGLAVGFDEDAATCPDCDAPVGDDVDKCPNCGAEFE